MEKIKLFCVSLGCDKNLVDTEKMLGLLNREGYAFTDDEGEADAILINTCCFIGDAKEESVNTILEMARLKEEGRCRALVVAGCLAQRYKEEILEEIPEVDGILGTTSCDEIVNVLNGILGREKPAPVSCFHDLAEPPTGGENRRLLRTSKDRRGLRQALYLLYHPLFARIVPQRSHGTAGAGGRTAG
jgi:ribosomal protein S12 methylthiotransferase